MRLIDADALIDDIKNNLWDWDTVDGIKAQTVLRQTITDIGNAPTIDAVPVVRCKDCRYYQDNNGGYPNADCKWCKDETPDANDYCSCGEREDDES